MGILSCDAQRIAHTGNPRRGLEFGGSKRDTGKRGLPRCACLVKGAYAGAGSSYISGNHRWRLPLRRMLVLLKIDVRALSHMQGVVERSSWRSKPRRGGLSSTEIKGKSTVWACFHQKMAQEPPACAGNHVFAGMALRSLQRAPVVSLWRTLSPLQKTLALFCPIRRLRSTARCSRRTLLGVDMTVSNEYNTCI